MHNFRPFTTKCAVTFAGFCLFCGPLQQITLFFSGIIGGNSLAINFGLQSTMAELLGEMAEIQEKGRIFFCLNKGLENSAGPHWSHGTLCSLTCPNKTLKNSFSRSWWYQQGLLVTTWKQ